MYHHGAALGATIAIITGEFISTKILAFVFSVIITMLVYIIAKHTFRKDSTFLVLTGINVNYFLSAIISLLMILNKDKLDKIVFWTMGSFTTSSWINVLILSIIILPAVILISFLGKYLNAMALDENTAKSIGINTDLFRGIMIGITCLITAICVSVSGIIGFVGLMIPHLVRLVFSTDYKYLIGLTALIGAIFMIVSDDFARLIISPTEIPIGIITAIFGAPYLVYLIYKRSGKAI